MIVSYVVTFVSGVIIGVTSNYVSKKLDAIFKSGTNDRFLRALKDKNNWTSKNDECYFYVNDPDFSITVSEPIDGLSDRYKKFPDKEHNYLHHVTAKYKGAYLYKWNFMSLDGFRILVPVPRVEYADENATENNMYEFYDLSSTEIKIFEVIGAANLTGETSRIDGLTNIARHLGVLMAKK